MRRLPAIQARQMQNRDLLTKLPCGIAYIIVNPQSTCVSGAHYSVIILDKLFFVTLPLSSSLIPLFNLWMTRLRDITDTAAMQSSTIIMMLPFSAHGGLAASQYHHSSLFVSLGRRNDTIQSVRRSGVRFLHIHISFFWDMMAPLVAAYP